MSNDRADEPTVELAMERWLSAGASDPAAFADREISEVDRADFLARVAALGRFRAAVDAAHESLLGGLDQPTIMANGGRDELADLPRRLDDYEILEEVGRGGMGVVLRARQISLDREVALKVLPAQAFATTHAAQRFAREAQAIARLRHPHIVPVYAVGEEDGHHFFAMPLLAGESLSERLNAARARGERGLAVARSAEIARHIASALAAAHDDGILHRDLKPSNILFDADDRPMLIDFGLARDVGTDHLTMTEQVLGTPVYMAPEQFEGRGDDDPRVDVFGLGAVLYELLTLRAPRSGPSLAAIIAAAQEHEPTPPRRLNAIVPRDLETICLKALDREPHRRYGDVRAFEADLVNFLEHRPIVARPAGPGTRAMRFTRRHRVPLAAAAFAVVGVLTLLLSLGLLGPGATPPPTGAVRFVNLVPDLVVEREDDGAWTALDVSAAGEVRLSPGAARLRVSRRNHFPVTWDDPTIIQEDRTLELAFASLSILRHARRVGPLRRELLVVPRDDQPATLLVRAGPNTFHLQAHSGATMPPLATTTLGGRDPWWVVRPGRNAQVAAIDGQTGKVYLYAEGVAAVAHEPFGAGVRVVAGASLDDLNGDGVRELVLASTDALSVWDPSRAVALWTRSIAARFVGVSPSGELLLVAGGRIRTRSARTGEAIRAWELPEGVEIVGDAACGTRRVGFTTPDGIITLDTARDEGLLVVDGPPQSELAPLATPAGDVFAVMRDRRLDLLDADTGFERWSRPIVATPPWQIAAGALDGTPGDEIVLGGSDGVVRAFDLAGSELWRFETRGLIAGRPHVTDLDGDGLGEVLVVSADETLYVLAGSARYRHWIAETRWAIGSRPIVGRDDAGRGLVAVAPAGAGRPPFDVGMPGPAVHVFDLDTGAPRWTHRAELALLTSPDVADVDGDGRVDLLVQDRSGLVTALDFVDGGERARLGGFGDFHRPPPRLADLDGDGRTEILLCADGALRAVTAGGDELWRRPLEAPGETWAVVPADAGGDGLVEVFVSRRDGHLVVLDGKSGEERRRLAHDGAFYAPVVVRDLDGDGRAEVLVGHHHPDSHLALLDGITFERRWRSERFVGIDSESTAADLDGDGVLDVIASTWEGHVCALSGRDGRTLWKTPVSRQGLFSSPAAGDLDGDGRPEIVVGAKERVVRILAHDGRVRSTVGVDAEVWGSPCLADVDGDGVLDVIIGADDGRVHAFPLNR